MRTDQEIWDDIALSDTVLEEERGNYPLNYNTSLLLEVLLNNREYSKNIKDKQVQVETLLTQTKTMQETKFAEIKTVLDEILDKRGDYVDRGDPSLWDFKKDDLTHDDAFHELDLSAIVLEEGASQLVHLRVKIKGTSGKSIFFTKLGQSNNVSSLWCRTQGSESISYSGFVKMDENRKIQYMSDSPSDWNLCRLIVRGWYKSLGA